MDFLPLLFPAALLALAMVLVVAVRHPILARMAARNTQRRPRQSALVVAGLLVGTAIVAAALVAGDSMEYAIVEATYDAFQQIDEMVYLDGYSFFPQSVANDLARDPVVAKNTDGVGVNILWPAAVTDEATRQYEPTVRMVGFDPHEAPVWGPFRAGAQRFSGADLGHDDVVLHEDLAKRLDAHVGDHLRLNFSLPLDPILPRIDLLKGQLNASAGPLPAPLPSYAEAQAYSHDFRVNATTVQISAALGWDPGPSNQDLDVELVSPNGTAYSNNDGTIGAPDGSTTHPAILNVTGSLAHPLPTGMWTLRVHAKAGGVGTRFQVLLVRLEPIFGLAAFQKRVAELKQEHPDFDPGAAAAAFTPRASHEVRVAFIFHDGKGPNFRLPTALNAFVRLDTLQGWLGREGQVNIVKVSNPGGVEDGPASAPRVFPLLYARLNATKDHYPADASVQGLKVSNEKVFWLGEAKQVGRLFSIFLAFVGSFSVLAGLMLIINIFTMLAEERKSELGISRAVGLRRDHLTRLFVLEGALYAVPAAVLGTFAGLGLAYGLIRGFNAFGDPTRFPPIPYRVLPMSLLVAFATGVLLTLGTVYVGARRVSRLNVVRAIRNLEEPEIHRGRLGLGTGLLLILGGALYTPYGYRAEHFAGVVLGPAAVALGLALLLRRRLKGKLVWTPLALALFAYETATLFWVTSFDNTEGNVFAPVRSVLMALCVVLALVQTEWPVRPLGRLAMRVKPLRAVALPATGYPLHKKFRAGMTLAMFAVILLVVSLFSIFGTLFAPDPAKEAGGYDVQGFSTVSFDRLEDHGSDRSVLERVRDYDTVPYFLQVGGTLVHVDGATTAQFGPPQDYVFGTSEAFAEHNGFKLLRRDPAYRTDRDAYLAVARGDDVAIAAYPYSADEHGHDDVHHVGAALTVQAKGGEKAFRVIGFQEQVHFKGVFVGERALETMFPNRDTLVLVHAKPGVDTKRLAHDLEGSYRDVGLDADDIKLKVLEESEQFRQIFTLVQLFLSLGLIVGILSLGIVTARSVIERRQEIGMMRALGYPRRLIRRTFLLEMWTTVGLGIAVGVLLAILISLGVWYTVVATFNIPYRVAWGELAWIAVIAFVATTLATLGPIAKAARTPPAEALRYIE